MASLAAILAMGKPVAFDASAVHLDYGHATRLRVDGELDIRATGVDTNPSDDADRGVTHDLVLLVGEGLRRSHRDRVSRMHSHGVKVLDGADDDDIVVRVAHHLELVFLPPEDRFFDQQFRDRAQVETAADDGLEFLGVVGDTAAGTAHGEGGTDDDRIPELGLLRLSLFQSVDKVPLRHLETLFVHGLLEQFPVFGNLDRFEAGTDQLHAVLLEDPRLGQLHRGVESRLAADGGQEGVGALRLDDLCTHSGRDRLDIGAVGHLGVGHDRRRIAVDQDDLVRLLAQCLARLGA